MRPVRFRRPHQSACTSLPCPLSRRPALRLLISPRSPSRYRAPLSTSQSGFARPARVRGLDDVVDVGVLLDDRVAVVALDDVLDPGDVVTRHDREPPCVASNALVLGPAEPD